MSSFTPYGVPAVIAFFIALLHVQQTAGIPQWSNWSQDIPCTVTCGHGYTERIRMCSTRNPRDCHGAPWEVLVCNVHTCSSEIILTTRASSSTFWSTTQSSSTLELSPTIKSSRSTSTPKSLTSVLPSTINATTTISASTQRNQTPTVSQVSTSTSRVASPSYFSIRQTTPKYSIPASPSTINATTRTSTPKYSTLYMPSTLNSTNTTSPSTFQTPIASRVSTSTSTVSSTLNSSTRASPSVSADLSTTSSIESTTRHSPSGHTIAPSPTMCAQCLEATDQCEILYFPQPCDPPNNYCINHVINRMDGSRYVNRSCGDFNTCYLDWYRGSSDVETCQNFEENSIVTMDFECTFCCVHDNCNVPLKPRIADLYNNI